MVCKLERRDPNPWDRQPRDHTLKSFYEWKRDAAQRHNLRGRRPGYQLLPIPRLDYMQGDLKEDVFIDPEYWPETIKDFIEMDASKILYLIAFFQTSIFIRRGPASPSSKHLKHPMMPYTSMDVLENRARCLLALGSSMCVQVYELKSPEIREILRAARKVETKEYTERRALGI